VLARARARRCRPCQAERARWAAGVDKASVDTWLHPHLFHMGFSTGAPPDYFDANGQNWGFPTYNWEAMAADGYAGWRARLSKLAACAPAGATRGRPGPPRIPRQRSGGRGPSGLCSERQHWATAR